jgi:hypothetical protein
LSQQHLQRDDKRHAEPALPTAFQHLLAFRECHVRRLQHHRDQLFCLDLNLPHASSVSVRQPWASKPLQGSTINLSSGPLRINGNAGIGQNGQFNFSGGGQISGVLDADPTAQINISGGGTTIAGGTVIVSMAAVQSAALAEASIAGALTPTQTFSQITSSQNIVGNGRQNVIQVKA